MTNENAIREIVMQMFTLSGKLLGLLPEQPSAPRLTLIFDRDESERQRLLSENQESLVDTVQSDDKLVYFPPRPPKALSGEEVKTEKENIKSEKMAILRPNFTKEVKKLSIKDELKDLLLLETAFATVRQKENGVYEIRLRRDGYYVGASSKDLSQARLKFIIKLQRAFEKKEKQAAERERAEQEAKKRNFNEFAEMWLESVKKPRVKAVTYSDYETQFRKHIFPFFKYRNIQDIRQITIHHFLNYFIEKNEQRTALKLYTTLKAIFQFAADTDVIVKSPMIGMQRPIYEAVNGKALTLEEEGEFVRKVTQSNSPCRLALLFALYTGARRSEIATAQFENDFVSIESAKQRKGKKIRRRIIPISPMLRPYVEEMKNGNALRVSTDLLSRTCAKLCPGHYLHELRHTFITRAQECGISRELVSVWVGHKLDNMTSSVYTHFSLDYQVKEAQKINYSLDR